MEVHARLPGLIHYYLMVEALKDLGRVASFMNAIDMQTELLHMAWGLLFVFDIIVLLANLLRLIQKHIEK